MAEICQSADGLPVSGSVGFGGGHVTQEPFVNISADSDSYAKSKEGGRLLVFNHEFFDRSSYGSIRVEDRAGTNIDKDNLVKTFVSLGVKARNIKIVENATFKRIKQEIEIARKFDYFQFDCLICCVLTHGSDKGILCAHDREYLDEIIFEAFRGNNCPSLVGKPKIFFIQACSGVSFDDGCLLATLESDGDADIYTSRTIPNTADFLIHRSTVPGYYSWRNKLEGSWFIQALTCVLKEAAESSNPDDLLSLLTVVNREVAYEFESRSNDPRFDGKKQQPSVYHTLTRKIHFFKKAEVMLQDHESSVS